MFAATSSYVEPSKKGLHVEEEEGGRECAASNNSSFYGFSLSASSRGQPDLCGGIFIKVLDYVNGICMEA